jgi:hypothetical protein
MDPFLESPSLWPSFHHQMMNVLVDALKPGERYQVGLRERHYPNGSAPGPTGAGERREVYLEIWEAKAGSLVTLVDLVSPANKTTDSGRQAYLHTRQQAKEARANLVEIDLVLQGRATLDYSREGLPDWDYAVTVTRAAQSDRYEIYTATLKKRLPRFRLPLADGERDIVVDLQVVFTQAYRQAGFPGRIHYRPEAIAGLKEVHRRQLAEWFHWPSPAAETLLSHEEIQIAAYYIWKDQGCPEGRAEEHWRLAIEQLQQRRGQVE